MQNNRLRELGIDPYEVDSEYTEEEDEIVNEAYRLIIIDEEVPEELATRVKEITHNYNTGASIIRRV